MPATSLLRILDRTDLWIVDMTPSIPEVVFVCEYGSKKSVVAAAYLAKRARERGVQLRAIARGLHPDAEIPAAIREALRADDVELTEQRPTPLSSTDVQGATAIVSFAEDLPETAQHGSTVLYWTHVPAMSDGYAAARDAIVHEVDGLIDRLIAREAAEERDRQ